ncbi:MAG: hypothetical protein U0807_06660 [Candidatus Binatia bacterium]
MASRFTASCLHCGQAVAAFARIGDGELAELRGHLAGCSTKLVLPDTAGAAETLHHFRVGNEPDPSETT